MANNVFADRVQETSSTTGTGTYTTSGVATSGFQTFASGVGNGNTTYYVAVGQSTNNWEVGKGVYTTAGSTLTRNVIASSNSNSAINWNGETITIFADLPAIAMNYLMGVNSSGGNSANITLTNPICPYQNISFAASGHSVTLPAMNTGNSPPNGWAITFINNGSYPYSIYLQDGTTVLISNLQPNSIQTRYLVDNSTANGSWGANSQNPVVPNYLTGLITAYVNYQNISVASGTCADSSNTAMINFGGGTLNIATVGVNGLDVSTSGMNWYHIFVIAQPGGASPALLASTSVTPTLPSGYTLYRRIGSFKTDSSHSIYPYTQLGDSFIWDAPMGDMLITEIPAANTAYWVYISVPPGVKVVAYCYIRFSTGTATGSAFIYVSSPLVSPYFSTSAPQSISMQVNGSGIVGDNLYIPTNTTQQIIYESQAGGSSSYTLMINTQGWIDTRGK